MTPIVSVIVPCFNAERYLAETVESALNQTVNDIEIILIDDGSTDGTAPIAVELSQQDDRIRVIRQPNHGVSSTRNLGVELAFAPVVAFLDSDDTWHPSFLERTLNTLNADLNIQIAFARCRIIDELGEPTGQVTRPKLSKIGIVDLLECNPTATCSNLVVKREVFGCVGGFRSDMQFAEDQEWLIRAKFSGFNFKGVNEALVNYRIRPGSLSSKLGDMLQGFDMLLENISGLSPDMAAAYGRRARASCLNYLSRHAARHEGSSSTSWAYLLAALRTDPLLLVRQWRTIMGTCWLNTAAKFPVRDGVHNVPATNS